MQKSTWPAAVPDPVALTAPFGRFEASSTITDDGRLVFTRFYEISELSIPADRYDEVRTFFATAAKSDRDRVVLVKEDNPAGN